MATNANNTTSTYISYCIYGRSKKLCCCNGVNCIASTDTLSVDLSTGIVHLSRDHLVHLDHKDHGDLLVIKENLDTQESQVHQVKMENQVNLENLESLVKKEKGEIISTKNA